MRLTSQGPAQEGAPLGAFQISNFVMTFSPHNHLNRRSAFESPWEAFLLTLIDLDIFL